jgi:hypothetical protein
MRCVLRPIKFPPRTPAPPARPDGITRHALCALPVILILAVVPTAAFAQPERAGAESLVCHAIKRGESAAQAARRVTGDGRSVYRSTFQIMNASSRFIPKSQYDRVRAGWRACVVKPAVVRASANAAVFKTAKASDAADASSVPKPNTPDVVTASDVAATGDALEPAVAQSPSAMSDVLRVVGKVDLTMLWLGAAMVVPWVGWRFLDDYLARRKTTAVVMQLFADRFVSEFERPLIRFYAGDHPVRSRVRHHARRGRFDILLAPSQGRRYPNLTDHKNNVEYDVARVLQTLADESFASGPLYMQAGWVVVPFQFKAGPKQAGVTCISSF